MLLQQNTQITSHERTLISQVINKGKQPHEKHMFPWKTAFQQNQRSIKSYQDARFHWQLILEIIPKSKCCQYQKDGVVQFQYAQTELMFAFPNNLSFTFQGYDPYLWPQEKKRGMEMLWGIRHTGRWFGGFFFFFLLLFWSRTVQFGVVSLNQQEITLGKNNWEIIVEGLLPPSPKGRAEEFRRCLHSYSFLCPAGKV